MVLKKIGLRYLAKKKLIRFPVVYTMDLPQAVTKGDVIMYADNVTIITYGRTLEETPMEMREAMAEYHACPEGVKSYCLSLPQPL